MICLTICCSKGIYFDGKCRCDLGYYGETCSKNIVDNFESEYFTFVGIFCLLFFILFCISLSLLVRAINSYDSFTYSNFYQRCLSVITAPKNLIFVLSLLLCIFRLLYIITYPFQPYQGDTRVIERLITDFPFTILFYVYGILLIVWYTIYDEISFNISTLEEKNGRDWIFRHYKIIMKIRLFLVLLLQIVISTINGLRLNTEFKTLLYFLYATLILNFISFILEFYVYGTNLYKCIQGQLQQQEQWFLEHREKEKALETQFDKSIIRKEFTSKSPNLAARSINGRSPIQQQSILNQYLQQKPVEQMKPAEIKPKLNQIKRKQSFGVTFVNRAPSMSSNFRQESFGEIGKQKTITEADIECSIIDGSDNTPQEFHDSPFTKKRSKSFVLEENDLLTIWDCQEQKDIVSQIQNNQIEVIKQTKQSIITETNLKKSQSPIQQYSQQDEGKNQYSYQFDLSFQNQLQEYFKLQKKQTLQTDMTVLKNIQLLVQCGILFEILFLILAIIVIATSLLQNPEGIFLSYFKNKIKGALIYLYVTNTLQFLSLVVVLKLFRDVQSKQIMNLIWIQKVGSKTNKINEKFSFILPQDIKETDKTMVKFEERINTQQFY